MAEIIRGAEVAPVAPVDRVVVQVQGQVAIVLDQLINLSIQNMAQ
jgi:hypothetical protein